MGLKNPSNNKSIIENPSSFLSSAPKNRLLSAIPVLTIIISKNTTLVRGRRNRDTPTLICFHWNLEKPIFGKFSLPVENKIINVVMQKNRLQ